MKGLRTLLIILFLPAVIVGCKTRHAKTESTFTDFATEVDNYLKAHVANDRFSGNVLITKGDSIIFSKAYGQANKNFRIENSDSTRFLIGSITKPFTAYAILLLENEGKLALDDKLSSYFPKFPNADLVTIRQLLTHTSGIRDYHAFKDWKTASKTDITPQTTIETVMSNPYIFKPGDRYSYTNSGYILLGLIIEKVSGFSFDKYIQKAILEPLKMSNSGVMCNEKIVPNLAEGYTTNLRETLKAEHINYAQPFSSGNMYSTPADLWTFTKAVMHSTLLPKEKTSEIFSVSDIYGYGWGVRNYHDALAYGHYGAMNGFVGSMTYLPDSDYFICFLTNNDNTPEYTIAEDLVGLLLGKEIDRPDLISLIDLNDTVIDAVVGSYLVKPGDTLHVFESSHRLYIQESGQIRHELFPFAPFTFDLTLFEFHAHFSQPIEGKTEMLQYVGRSNVNAKRIASHK